MDEPITNFASTLSKTKMFAMTDHEKLEHAAATVCYLRGEKPNRKDWDDLFNIESEI